MTNSPRGNGGPPSGGISSAKKELEAIQKRLAELEKAFAGQ